MEKSQWIPCSEKLPPRKKQVLVCVKDQSILNTGYLVIMNGGKLMWDLEGYWSPLEVFEVIAWMELPEPYKENNS